MLTLNDGRSELWQWDTGRKLTVDADCSQVHFSNKVFGRSIDVDVVDGIAIIPDILLQTDKELTSWAFVGTPENGYTKISKVFKVNKRNKPADYVFTPPEQTTLSDLVERLDEIEKNQDPDAIKNAVEDYLEQNPVEAPVKSVNGQTGEVKLTAGDVGAISQDDLQEATNEALAQAKASGEFDGQQGQKGDKGEPGADGKTPIKGTDYFTEADKQEIAEQAAEMVEIPDGVELDTTLTASGKAADAKSVGDALNGKLDKSGGTLNGNLTIAGNIILPRNGSAGIRDNTDNPMFRNETIDGEFSLRIGHKGARLHLYSSERPKYNGNEVALKKEIPDVSGITPYPGDDHINDLIDTALGVIENGTY